MGTSKPPQRGGSQEISTMPVCPVTGKGYCPGSREIIGESHVEKSCWETGGSETMWKWNAFKRMARMPTQSGSRPAFNLRTENDETC